MNGKISKTLSDTKTGAIFCDFGKSKTVYLKRSRTFTTYFDSAFSLVNF